MIRSYKKYVGVFLFFLFVFPSIQQGIHGFEHRHDFHCDAKTEKHLHEQEHHCDVCDYSIPVSNCASFGNITFVLSYTPNYYKDFRSTPIFFNGDFRVPARAPPLA